MCLRLDNIFSFFCMYGLLTKREVKITGYWPSSFFFFFAFLWAETESRYINTQRVYFMEKNTTFFLATVCNPEWAR